MLWRRWRRLPEPAVERKPERHEAFVTACAIYAATHERTLLDIAESFAARAAAKAGVR